MECVANIVFQSMNIDSRDRKLWYKRVKMVAIGVGTTIAGLFILIMSFQAVQTYHSSKQEFAYNLKEFDNTFNEKYVSFNPCDHEAQTTNNNDAFSKMLTTTFYIRKYLKSNRKIMDKKLMDNNNININKNDNICTYYECDKTKIQRVNSLIEEYKKTDTKLDYSQVTIANEYDIWTLNDDKKSKYFNEKMVNINYCPKKQFYEWTKLRRDLCLLFQCKSLMNDAKHLNLQMNTDATYDNNIQQSLVIDLSDNIQCNSKLFILQWLPYFSCVSDPTNYKQIDIATEYMIVDIDYYLKQVENKKVIYVIKNTENDNIYKGIDAYYTPKSIQLIAIDHDSYNNQALNLLMIASKAQCFIGNFFNDLSNGIVLNRGWNNNNKSVCNGWYKTHGMMSNIKFIVFSGLSLAVIYYGFHFFVYACFFKNRMKISQYVVVFVVVLTLFVMFLMAYNIFEIFVNVLMEFKFM